MKQSIPQLAAGTLVLGLSFFYGCKPKPVVEANRLPQDVKVSCVLPDSTFNSWFGGTITENGMVQPANSVAFPNGGNCDFYNWSEQMFLWITSPVHGGPYGGSKTVMESEVFFTVEADSIADDNQGRLLIPHTPGTTIRAFAKGIKQVGPNGLPVIADKKGHLFEVENADRNLNNIKPAMVAGAQNAPLMVHHVNSDNNGANVFFDEHNNVIANPKAVIKHSKNRANIVQHFVTNSGKHVLLDANSKQMDAESAQATGDVLVAQNGSPVYYITMVNDVYAYFVSGARNKQLTDTTLFPTTTGARDSICAYARNAYGKTLPDSNALAMGIKTSWVEAVNLPDAEGSYFTMEAIIPTYKKVDSANKWVLSKSRKAKLALIGMHVVGSTLGHPEMIWATFEHRKNAPNAAYKYIAADGTTKTVAADTGSNWLLSNNGADTAPNVTHQHWSNDTIVGTSSAMTPSNSSLVFPWGTAMDSLSNPQDTTSAASNSEVISINNQVFNMLKGKDIRKNYMLIGATWTQKGTAPNGNNYSRANIGNDSVAVGTNCLANSTMETYIQQPTASCLFCHNSNGTLNPYDSFGLSHVYVFIKPLPQKPKAMEKK